MPQVQITLSQLFFFVKRLKERSRVILSQSDAKRMILFDDAETDRYSIIGMPILYL